MLDSALLHEPPHALKLREDLLIRILDVLPHEVRHLVRESPIVINRARNAFALCDNALLEAHAVVVLAKRRRLHHGLRRLG